MSDYLKLTKFGITLFVLITGLAGFALSLPVGREIDIWQPIVLLVGLYFLSSGSFAINQAQEHKIDRQMARTKHRPVASGKIAAWQAYVLGILYVVLGSALLLVLNPLTAILGLTTVFLYNVIYTLYWKRKWIFGAVPGALPGAMPVLIGYAASGRGVYSAEALYLFLVMFLWQMPHFWSLAMKYREDYRDGGIPVLPVALGSQQTLYHIGLYVFCYIGVALASPWFVNTHLLYVLLIFADFVEGGRGVF